MTNKLKQKNSECCGFNGKIVFLDVFPIHWPADLGPIAPETFRQCGFGGAVTLDFSTGLISLFGSNDLTQLCEKLRGAKLVVGFNCLSFDQSIITGAGGNISGVRWFDLMESIRSQAGKRCSLAQLVELNFGIRDNITLKQHREQIEKQNQIWLLQRSVNGVSQMSRLFSLVKDQGRLVFLGGRLNKPTSLKLNWNEI